MWAGNQPWLFPARLDIGRDDYYGHGRSDCADLARSPYLTSNPPPPPVLAVTLFRAGHARTAPQDADGDPRGQRRRRAPAPPARPAAPAVWGRVPSVRVSASFAAGAARCRWRFPAGSKGKRFRGTVRATVGGLSATAAAVSTDARRSHEIDRLAHRP